MTQLTPDRLAEIAERASHGDEAHYKHLYDVRALLSHVSALTAEIAALRRDAERFVWLDEEAPIITAKPENDYCVWSITFHSKYGTKADEYELETAVDSAMSGGAK